MPAPARAPAVVPAVIGRLFYPGPVLWTYRIWSPGTPYYTTGGSQTALTLATQFSVSQSCALDGIWWYSYSSATVLPSVCGVWDIGSQVLTVEDAAPDWTLAGGGDAAAGDGWVYCDFTAAAVTLVSSEQYYVAVFQGTAGAPWYSTASGYWTSGAGAAGITSGPLTAPDAGAAVNGQGCYASGQWTFPDTNPGDGEVYYADVAVTLA